MNRDESTKKIIDMLVEACPSGKTPNVSGPANAGWYVMIGLGVLAAQVERVADVLENQRLGQDHVPTVREEADMPLTKTTPSNTAFSVMKASERIKGHEQERDG